MTLPFVCKLSRIYCDERAIFSVWLSFPPGLKPPLDKRKAPGRYHGCSGLAAEGEQAQPNAHGRLNPAAVKQFLGMLQQLEPAFFTDGELLQENEWLDAVPARAADSRDSG